MMHKILEIAATVTDACFMAWFVPTFCGVSIKSKYWTLVFPVMYCVLQLTFDTFLTGFDIVPVIMVFVFAAVFSFLLMRGHCIWSLFCSSCFGLIMMLANTLLFVFFSVYLEDISVIMPGSNMGMRTLFLIIAKIALFIFYKLIVILFSKDKKLARSGGAMSLTLSFATVVGLTFLMKIATKAEYAKIDTEVFVIAFLLSGINIVFYLLLRQNQSLQKSKYEFQLMKDRISFEEKRGEEAAIIWDNIKKVRHDLKNHFCYLRAQLEASNYEECKKYLLEIQSSVDSMGNLIKSGNSVVDYLINTKLSSLKDAKVFIAGDVSNFSDISDIDMVCILGNILDNAVEALEKIYVDKRVELFFTKVNDIRIIACKNTIASSVLDADNHLILTKDDVEFHGLGHKIVENTALKYGGYVDYFEENDMFGVQVSIPEPLNNCVE